MDQIWTDKPITPFRCEFCGASARPHKFCDLTRICSEKHQVTICHDCADKIVTLLMDRYYALWGQSRWFSDGSGPATP